METNELLKRVRRIEIKSKALSDQMFNGGYHSAFKGRGISFSEIREYQWGDDIRNIDWNVTARYEKPYIKVFEEERELEVLLVVDVSPSTFFGTQLSYQKEPQQKADIIAEICALLAFAAMNNQDKVGLILFTDRIEKIIPAQRGRNHVLRIIREMIDMNPEGRETDLNLALKTADNLLGKRSIVFLISDFFHSGEPYKDSLGILRKRHDVVGVHVYDDIEKSIPEGLVFLAEDSETGKKTWVDTSDSVFRTKYQERFERNKQAQIQVFKAAGADFLSINTKDAYISAFLGLFKMRERKY